MDQSKRITTLLFLMLIIDIVSGCTVDNCQTCVNPDICDSCTPPYILDKTQNICQNCSDAIPNCSNCTGIMIPAIICTTCVSGFAVNTTDNTCVTCKTLTGCSTCVLNALKTQLICLTCNSPYVLSNGICINCSEALSNCNICNDTVFPLSCVNCLNGYYSTNDNLHCDTCQNLIQNCANCSFQAPFQKVQCSHCIGDYEISSDNYSCNQSNTWIIITAVSVGVGVIVFAIIGYFIYKRWKRQKGKKNPLMNQQQSN